MYCVFIIIKHPKKCSQVILFIGEPQNLTQLGYHLSFGLKDLIYVKIRAHPALARLGRALARSRTQIDESVLGTALERPSDRARARLLRQRLCFSLLISSGLSNLSILQPTFKQLLRTLKILYYDYIVEEYDNQT